MSSSLRSTHGDLPPPPASVSSHGDLPPPPRHGNLPSPPVTGTILMVEEGLSQGPPQVGASVYTDKGDFNYPDHLKDPVGRKQKIAKSFFFMLGTQIASREARRAIGALISFLVLAMFMRNIKRATKVIIDKQECQTRTYTTSVNETNNVMQNMTQDSLGVMNQQSACYGALLTNFQDTYANIILNARGVRTSLDGLQVGGFPVPGATAIGSNLFGKVIVPLSDLTPNVKTPTVDFDIGVVDLNLSTNTDEVAKKAADDQAGLAKILDAINWTQLAVMIGSWLYLLWVAYDLVFKAVFVRWRSLKDWIIYIQRNFYKILNKMMIYMVFVLLWYFVLFTQYIIQVIASYSAKLTMKESDLEYNYDLQTQGCGSNFGKKGEVKKAFGINCAMDFKIETIPSYIHILIWVWYFYPIVNIVVQYITSFTMNRFPHYFETAAIAKARKQARRKWKDETLYSEN